MSARDNPKLREIVERRVQSIFGPIDMGGTDNTAAAARLGRMLAYAVLDEVLGPLRELIVARNLAHTEECGERWFKALETEQTGDVPPCECGVLDLELQARENETLRATLAERDRTIERLNEGIANWEHLDHSHLQLYEATKDRLTAAEQELTRLRAMLVELDAAWDDRNALSQEWQGDPDDSASRRAIIQRLTAARRAAGLISTDPECLDPRCKNCGYDKDVCRCGTEERGTRCGPACGWCGACS